MLENLMVVQDIIGLPESTAKLFFTDCSLTDCLVHSTFYRRKWIGPHHQPWVRGGSSEPPVWPPKDFIYTVLTVHFKCPTVAKWSASSLAAIENHHCASKSCCNYAGLFLEDQRRTHACELFTSLWWKLRPRVNTCINISLWQAREFTMQLSYYWCYLTHCSANLSTFSRGNLHVMQPKIGHDEIDGSAFVKKLPQ